MSRLRYAGLTGTVGSGNMTNSATSHTFTAALTYGNGVTVPTLVSPDYFMLSILDTSGNLSEVVKVTAYNSGTKAATIVRGQEGTSGVSHTSGDKVTLAAYSSDFPALRNVDDPNDDGWLNPLTYDVEFDTDGTSLPSGWSWVNQGTGTWAQSFGAGVLTHLGGSSDDVKMVVRNVPTESAWVATAKVGAIATEDIAGFVAGLVLRNSSSGKLLIVGPRHNPLTGAMSPTFAGFYFTNTTTFDTSAFTTLNTLDVYRYVRIQKVSATSWSLFGSPDGVAWHTLTSSHDVSAKFTPDQIGLGLYRVTARATSASFHWFRVR